MKALTYAVRARPVLKYSGLLAIAMAVLTLVPLVVALCFGSTTAAWRYAAISAGAAVMGSLLVRLERPRQIQDNEAMVLTALVFLLSPLALSWPAMAAGIAFSDALFETISAVTTTGLSTVADISRAPASFLFARAWTQWIGGLGIVVLSLAILIQPGTMARKLGDDFREYEKDPVGGTRTIARTVFTVYSLVTLAGILMLAASGTSWFNAVVYAFAAVSTGGFSPHPQSLAGLNTPLAQGVVILISVGGAVPLLIFRGVLWQNWKKIVTDRQILMFLAVGCIVSLLLWGSFYLNGLPGDQALFHGIINGFSAQTTAGFSSLDLSRSDALSKVILMGSMFLGGCCGSTAGGIKILRLLIIVRIVQLMILRAAMPKNAVMQPTIGNERLSDDELIHAAGIVFAYAGAVLLSWVPFIVAGFDPLNALFEVVSAISTAGLSAGVSGPDLHWVLKIVLCMDMLLGRLEIFAWLILFSPATWFGTRIKG